MTFRLHIGVVSGLVAIATMLALAPDARADGEWKAPDVTLFLGSDIFSSGQTDKPGPALNATISNYWSRGECTYDSVTGAPSAACDRLRFGLAMFRGPNQGNQCPAPFASLSSPKENGGAELTQGGTYHVAQLQSDAGALYCDDFEQRTLGDSMLAYRDHRFAEELGTNWPDRPQLTLQLIENLPQTDADTEDQVRESLLAACDLFEGNGDQHLSMPTWVMLSPNLDDDDTDVELFAGMLAAAGGTGQCCYKPDHGGSCDPTSTNQVLDMCDHLRQTNADGETVHDESLLRDDIDDQKYNCTDTGKPAGPGAMKSGNFKDMKCHLQGSPCEGNKAPDKPAYLWPTFSCIQLRPANISPDELSVDYCGEVDGEPVDDVYDDKDGDGCITLTPGNGIEYIDANKNLYYYSHGDSSMCRGISSHAGWTEVNCPNMNTLCDLDDGSQCSLGRIQCDNGGEYCAPFPGNTSCESSACAPEEVHDVGVVHPNVQLVVDKSGSMEGSRWRSARDVAENLAVWGYNESGCEDDGTNCDKVRLGVHFWSGEKDEQHPAQEDLTPSMMENAFNRRSPDGGTDFHLAAELLRDESALDDPDHPNAGIFLTDGAPTHAFTTREAVRHLCDLGRRPGSPVATYAVGYQDGNQQLNSLVAAAGGTGSCCFADDGTCDDEPEFSPCEMYQYELDHGERIVDEFEDFLEDHTRFDDEWDDITDAHAGGQYTSNAYRTGTVAQDLDMVDDVARYLYAQTGADPDDIDCSVDAGNPNAGSSYRSAFYRHIICEMQNTLSYVVRHEYAWNSWFSSYTDSAEDVPQASVLEQISYNSTFLTHDYVCTGAKQADHEDALYAELQAILQGMECAYPLSLLDGMDGALEFPEATRVKLYLPRLGTVLSVPHVDNDAARAAFVSELESLGFENPSSFADDGWSFANEGRTAVNLSAELCNLTKTDPVERVTTQVCRMCDPDLVGTPCNYVACDPKASTIDGDIAYTDDGEMCERSEYPCPENPNETCSGWVKTGRCGLGEYACDEEGFPYCEQVHSRMPEICNGIDDDCDGSTDDLRENYEEWSSSKYDISGTDYDGWYCGYRDTCRCQTPDSIGGTMADGDLEFQRMLEHQQANGECVCGEGLSEYEPTYTEAPASAATAREPQAGCSSAGNAASGGFAAMLVGLLLSAVGLRRRAR